MSVPVRAHPAPAVDTEAGEGRPVQPVVEALAADVYRVAVRTLCAFGAKEGDLDLRFTPSPTSLEGIAGHRLAAARRGDDYEREIGLECQWQALLVRGRADGYDGAANRLDEVKTFRGDLARQPANHRALHWAQAKVYGWMLCRSRLLPALNIALVYLDVDTSDETVFEASFSAGELETFFDALCERFVSWAAQQAGHLRSRDRYLNGLGFPHADFRPGQRSLAEAVYKAARQRRCLILQAPTGLGKTMGAMFPMLKAMPREGLDKILFLTAKTSGRGLALRALDALHEPGGGHLRVIELVARDKACVHPDRACHGESCPLAAGFYDRLPGAREEAVQQSRQTAAVVGEIAAKHAVCPYYLSHELAQWADVVVGDYNYYFDQSALLWAFGEAQQWRTGVLIDEAHNLLERGRGMYSAELAQAAYGRLRRDGPAVLRKPLDKLMRQWRALAGDQTASYEVSDTLPEAWLRSLREWLAAVGGYLVDHPDGLDAACRQAYLDALGFARLAEHFGEHSLFDITRQPAARAGSSPSANLCLRNVVPAHFLRERFARAHACVMFSATLQPWHFHARMLGLPENPVWMDVESPFAASQLEVRVGSHISTRYNARRRTLPAVTAAIADQYRRRPGNYLAFFSSFDYLNAAQEQLREICPDIPVRVQQRGMAEAEQRAFLEMFSREGVGIAFAVLGGVFAEGIDLPGEQLIGAFIATLGLPQVNPVNEAMRGRLDQIFGAGYDYVYTYPGLQKVVQAAGRVIRTPTDSGVICLLDDRYDRPAVRALLPAWWPEPVRIPPRG